MAKKKHRGAAKSKNHPVQEHKDAEESKPLKEISLDVSDHINEIEVEDPEVALANKVIQLQSPKAEDRKQKSEAKIEDGQAKESIDIENREIDPNASCTQVDYYRGYFDLDSDELFRRMKLSLTPWKATRENFLNRQPVDMYGPFWIATTLIFSLTASGNLSAYFTGENVDWSSESTKIVTAMMIIYSFISFCPLVFYFMLRQAGANVKFTEMVCIYGYSLTVFIPVTVLSIINIELLRLGLLLLGTVVSVALVGKCYWNEISIRMPEKKWIAAGVGTGSHTILLLTCMFYFFKFDLDLEL
mmetsp:Transcript_37748/g.42753  ORF Transcript_37748/g.42753 Transcript_37748/m.42753 type:complete len:301 (+) Transcript_37748:60-962(+)